MKRSKCPVELLAEELSVPIKLSPDLCALCPHVTSNTLIARYGDISVDYIQSCTAVQITVGSETLVIPNRIYSTMRSRLKFAMGIASVYRTLRVTRYEQSVTVQIGKEIRSLPAKIFDGMLDSIMRKQ